MTDPLSHDPPFDPPYVTIIVTENEVRKVEVLENGEQRISTAPPQEVPTKTSQATTVPARNKTVTPGNNQSFLFLTVPYSEKDDAKRFGAKWNPSMRKWYVPHGIDINLFKKWWPTELT